MEEEKQEKKIEEKINEQIDKKIRINGFFSLKGDFRRICRLCKAFCKFFKGYSDGFGAHYASRPSWAVRTCDRLPVVNFGL